MHIWHHALILFIFYLSCYLSFLAKLGCFVSRCLPSLLGIIAAYDIISLVWCSELSLSTKWLSVCSSGRLGFSRLPLCWRPTYISILPAVFIVASVAPTSFISDCCVPEKLMYGKKHIVFGWQPATASRCSTKSLTGFVNTVILKFLLAFSWWKLKCKCS